jgi:hypothetical protein
MSWIRDQGSRIRDSVMGLFYSRDERPDELIGPAWDSLDTALGSCFPFWCVVIVQVPDFASRIPTTLPS